MIKNKIGTGALILAAMLLVGMALIPAVSAQQEDSFSEDEYNLPDYGPSIFADLKDDSDVIETRGVMPEITEVKEKVEWLDTLETCIENSTDELDPYMKENGGPLIGFGHHVDGYIFVVFNEKLRDTIDESTMDKMYTIISNDGINVGLSEVPVVFKTGNTPQVESRTSTWTTLIGGIRIERSTGTGSTLSFAAEDSSGTKGFVMSGHAAYEAGIGGPIYQPDTSRLVGYVEDIGGDYADAAWVEATNVEAEVYHDDNDVRSVTDSGDPSDGLTVYMSGITSGKRRGTVEAKYQKIDNPYFGTLEDQCTATYDSDNGDSGAPVYKLTPGGVKIVGIHWGSDENYAFFSPISGVITDLGVEPLEV